MDSSVAAHLLVREGHAVIGVQFTLWHDPLAPALAQVLPDKCCNAQTLARSRKVAEDLGIPLHRLDLSEDFKREVVDPFLRAHREGVTPNPCIWCNRKIKFGKLFELAEELGCEKLATGHYARVCRDVAAPHLYTLLEALDRTKDQSYFLYSLTQEQLSRVLFPLGTFRKSEVFTLAKHFGVPLPKRYEESQDLCFFPEKTPHAFLDRYLSPPQGEITDTGGKKRGTHRGLPHYTEGQRHGLGIGGLKIPLHVVLKDAQKNRLVVGTREEAMKGELEAQDLHWIAHVPEKSGDHPFEARIHSLGKRLKGTLRHDGRKLRFRFEEPQLGVSPGQHIVLYRGEEVVGGGVITRV